MKKILILFICFLSISSPSRLQSRRDSTKQKKPSSLVSVNDSVKFKATAIDSNALRAADSVAKALVIQQNFEKLERFQKLLKQQPAFPFSTAAVPSNLRDREDNHEALFYFLVALLSYFACIRLIFGKYLDNLMTLFFRVTMRQQQIRDQLLQNPLPSLLLNILFVISTGYYLALLSRYYNLVFVESFWLTLLYAIGLVSAIYLAKFVVLKLTGWVFNIRSATDTYVFIVFLVNKMIGVFLLPFIILMSFPDQLLMPVLVLLSYIMLGLFLGYRFLNSFRPIRSEIKVNRFHFFLYLCAFEIAPLLLICKVLLAYVERSI